MGKPCVLVFDDSPLVRSSLARELSERGYDAREVGGPFDLLAQLESGHAVIIDVLLGEQPTILEVWNEACRLFPHLTVNNHNAILRHFRLADEQMVDGVYLAALVRVLGLVQSTIVLTAKADETLFMLLREKGIVGIEKASAPNKPPSRKVYWDALLGELEGVGGLRVINENLLLSDESSRPPVKPPKTEPAHDRTADTQTFADTRNIADPLPPEIASQPAAGIRSFLAAEIGKLNRNGLRAEVLYYNRASRHLEQIAQVGLTDTPTATMFVREVADDPSDDSIEGMGLCAFAASTKRAVLAPDVRFDRRYRALDVHDMTRSELVVPLLFRDEVLGVLNLEADTPYAFTGQDLENFESISSVLAALVENEMYRQEETFLSNALRQLSDAHNEQDLLKRTLNAIVQEMRSMGSRCSGCVLVPVGGERNVQELRFVANEGLTDVSVGEVRRLDKLGVIRRAVENADGREYWTHRDTKSHYVPFAPGILSELALALKAPDGALLAVVDIESLNSAITHRYQRALTRIVQFTTALLLSFRQVSRVAVTEAVEALGRELHTIRGTVEIFLADLAAGPIVATSIERVRAEVVDHIKDAEQLIQRVLDPPVPVAMSKAFARAIAYAARIGVTLDVSAPDDMYTAMSEGGLRAILDNMLVNTRKHFVGAESPRAWLVLTRNGLTAQLDYWDNGVAPPDALEAAIASGGRGLSDLDALSQRYHWDHEVSRRPEGGLMHRFTFGILSEEQACPA